MQTDLKRIRSIIYRMHVLRLSWTLTDSRTKAKFSDQIRLLESRLQAHLSEYFPKSVAPSTITQPEVLDVSKCCWPELQLSERYRFMLLERLYTQGTGIPEMLEAIHSIIDKLRIAYPAERRAHLAIELSDIYQHSNVFDHTVPSSRIRQGLLNECTRLIIHSAMTHLTNPYFRLTFLVDDQDDTFAISSIIDSKVEVFSSNEEINFNLISMAKRHVDIVTLFLSPQYLVICEAMSAMSIETHSSAHGSYGDPFHSRFLLENSMKCLRNLGEISKPDSPNWITLLSCVLFLLIITMDPIPSGLYLHFALVRDFFQETIDADLKAVYGKVFKLIQRITPDPNADIITFIDSN
jgi:hypothetical protein